MGEDSLLHLFIPHLTNIKRSSPMVDKVAMRRTIVAFRGFYHFPKIRRDSTYYQILGHGDLSRQSITTRLEMARFLLLGEVVVPNS